MKQVLKILCFVFGSLVLYAASTDFYTDEQGRTYVLGSFGEKIYSSGDRKYERPKPEEPQLEVLNFATELFNAVKTEGKNTVISSLSPQMILSFLALKSTNEATKKEIKAAAGYDNTESLDNLIQKIQSQPTARELKIGNGIFVSGETLKAIFNNSNSIPVGNFDLVRMEFNNPEKAKDTYRRWVSDKTKGVINDASIDVSQDLKAIIASTVYFKGEWLFDFKEQQKRDFNLENGQKVVVDAMRIRKKFHAGNFENDIPARWGVIPYNSTEAMILILPNEGEKLDDVVQKLKGNDLKEILTIATGPPTQNFLNVTLPKFTIKSTVELKEPLERLNIKKIFTEEASLKLFDDIDIGPVVISNAKQQTFLEVDEKGSIGASTTMFSAIALSVQPEYKHTDFIVDRPFAAIIIDRKYGVPYFLAKIYDPRV